jgi:hypothetical protein
LAFIILTNLSVLKENQAVADRRLAVGIVGRLPPGQADSLLRFGVCRLSSTSAASALAEPRVLNPDLTHPRTHSSGDLSHT